MYIIWILLISYAIYIIYKNKNEKKQKTIDMNKKTRNQSVSTNNSYYSNKKVNSYNKVKQDHINNNDIKDISNSIGYKRCPHCDSIISKKSSTCFMCDYEFIDDSNK